MSNVVVRDDLHPEDNAMIQALYSRSPARFVDHLEKVEAAGSGKFMEQYYVGYNHKSIGDCGSTTIFIEGVSMLAAKAIQDWPLYKGQEASTRYMDFSKVQIENPHETDTAEAIQKRWMAFYFELIERLPAYLREKLPRLDGQDEKKYAGAIKARSFDIARGFIPAGASTSLSWHGDLRQMSDHLQWMVMHPDESVRLLAYEIEMKLQQRYPNSGFGKRYFESEAWKKKVNDQHYFFDVDHSNKNEYDFVGFRRHLSLNELDEYVDVLRSRPAHTELPPWMAELGTIRTAFWLDFGSYRDLQRHRNGVVRMPLLTTKHGFHDWYLDQLPEDLRTRAVALIAAQLPEIEGLVFDGEDSRFGRQYYIPMGFRVPCQVTQSLPAFVYRVELRTAKTVHPTLRRVVQEEARKFRAEFGDLVRLHVDMDPDDWDIKRGGQTIEAKS